MYRFNDKLRGLRKNKSRMLKGVGWREAAMLPEEQEWPREPGRESEQEQWGPSTTHNQLFAF